MSEWQERLLIERAELGSKLEKLTVFIGSDTFAALQPIDRQLLTEQYAAMKMYYGVLGDRIYRMQKHVQAAN